MLLRAEIPLDRGTDLERGSDPPKVLCQKCTVAVWPGRFASATRQFIHETGVPYKTVCLARARL
jgi:hypothetical protein